jgi:hypothetical protein
MDRRAFLGALASGLLAPPLAAEAQQAVKVYRVGTLHSASREDAVPRIAALERGLAESVTILAGWLLMHFCALTPQPLAA